MVKEYTYSLFQRAKSNGVAVKLASLEADQIAIHRVASTYAIRIATFMAELETLEIESLKGDIVGNNKPHISVTRVTDRTPRSRAFHKDNDTEEFTNLNQEVA